jgi:hypothetical protein
VIKAFQDSIDRHLPQFVTLDRLRAAIVPKLSSFYDDNQPLSPINNVTMTTDNPITTTIQDTQYLEQFNKN